MLSKSDIKNGTEITCIIDGYIVTSATIQIEDGMIYVCQNVIEGDVCNNKLGYRYSWSIADISTLEEMNVRDFFDTTGVYDVKLKKQPDWDTKENGE